MTAPMNTLRSSTGPTFSLGSSSSILCWIVGQRLSGTYRREAAEHFWPWYSKAPLSVLATTSSGSAEECTKMKSFPPVSPTIRGKLR